MSDGMWPTFFPGKDDDDEDESMYGYGTGLTTDKSREELRAQWDLLKKYVEQFSGQVLSEGDLKVNILKKVNFTIKKLLDEVISMEEHIRYLEGRKRDEHPLYPSDPFKR